MQGTGPLPERDGKKASPVAQRRVCARRAGGTSAMLSGLALTLSSKPTAGPPMRMMSGSQLRSVAFYGREIVKDLVTLVWRWLADYKLYILVNGLTENC